MGKDEKNAAEYHNDLLDIAFRFFTAPFCTDAGDRRYEYGSSPIGDTIILALRIFESGRRLEDEYHCLCVGIDELWAVSHECFRYDRDDGLYPGHAAAWRRHAYGGSDPVFAFVACTVSDGGSKASRHVAAVGKFRERNDAENEKNVVMERKCY